MAAETGLAAAGFVASTAGLVTTIERAAFRANGGRAGRATSVRVSKIRLPLHPAQCRVPEPSVPLPQVIYADGRT